MGSCKTHRNFKGWEVPPNLLQLPFLCPGHVLTQPGGSALRTDIATRKTFSSLVEKKPIWKTRTSQNLIDHFPPQKVWDAHQHKLFPSTTQTTSDGMNLQTGHILPQISMALTNQPRSRHLLWFHTGASPARNQEQHMGSGIGSDLKDLPMK